MWTRRFLWAGVVSSVVAAAITVAGFAALVFAAELAAGKPMPSSPLQGFMEVLRAWMLLGILGVVIYAICWYRLVYASRDYSPGNTVALMGVSYIITAAVGSIPFWGPTLFEILTRTSGTPMEIIFMAFGMGMMVLFWTLGVGMLLFIPYELVATPIAFLQRAVLLRAFRSPEPTVPKVADADREPRATQ
jgi:hypothetical protein